MYSTERKALGIEGRKNNTYLGSASSSAFLAKAPRRKGSIMALKS